MTPQEQSPSGNSDFPSMPEMLSDEEIRSRAAAYAQRIYEQQLEAYEAQRARAMEVLRLQKEYARQQAAYEEACRAYYAQQQLQPAVRIDAETGEEVYAREQDSESPAQPEEPLPEQDIPASEDSETNEFSDSGEMLPADGVPSEEISVSSDPVADGYSAEEDAPEFAEEDKEPWTKESGIDLSEEEELSSDEAPELLVSPGTAPVAAPETEAPTIVVAAPRFPLISVMLGIICVAALSAEGYILFSDDPRFERQRNNFFSAIGWDNAVNPTEDAEKSAPKKLELPELRRKIEAPAPEPVETSAPETSVQETDAEAVVTEESVETDFEQTDAVDEEPVADSEEDVSLDDVDEEEEGLFSDEDY